MRLTPKCYMTMHTRHRCIQYYLPTASINNGNQWHIKFNKSINLSMLSFKTLFGNISHYTLYINFFCCWTKHLLMSTYNWHRQSQTLLNIWWRFCHYRKSNFSSLWMEDEWYIFLVLGLNVVGKRYCNIQLVFVGDCTCMIE